MELSVQAFDRICRTCLTESSYMQSLFTKLESGQQLLDLLIFTANIDTENIDTLPKQVCDDCAAFIHKAHEFKRRCNESEIVLKNLCESSSIQSITKTDDYIHKIHAKLDFCDEKPGNIKENDLSKPDFNCLLANPISFQKLDSPKDEEPIKQEFPIEYDNDGYSNDFDDEEVLAIPIEVKNEECNQTHKCACGKKFDDMEKIKVHLKEHKCIKYKKRSKRQQFIKTCIPIKNELNCQKCDLLFETLSSWTEHQTTHTESDIKAEEPPKFQCSLCFRQFKTKKTLSKHIKRHEATDNIRHTCTKCKREFKYKAFLESHMLTVHAKVTDGFICEICTAKCQTRKSLEVHMDSHKNKKNICPFCDKSFVMLCTLKDHLRIHTGEKPFLCSVCGKGFSQKTNLGQHMRRHMGVKPFNCDICNKGFVSKGELDAHNRKHSGAHPFKCDDCGNGFTTSSALVKHRRTHTGERPYACDLCPMRFAATGTLKNHRRTHTGERPYQCSHCEKSFVQRSDLISHIRCHTGERPFVCPQCGQAFRKAAAMKAHVKMHARETQNAMGLQGIMGMGLHCDTQIS